MASDAGLPRRIVKINYENIAPRFGYAWRPFGARTVIRGGYAFSIEPTPSTGTTVSAKRSPS